MQKNMIFIDTETSGLVAGRHTILQLAWIIEIDGKIVIELDKLHHDLMEFTSSNPIVPCGHKVQFDLDMLYALAKKGVETWWINYGVQALIRICRPVCTLALCHYLDYKGHLNLSDYKLATVCKHFDIDLTEAHDALADVRATRQVFHKLEELLEDKLEW